MRRIALTVLTLAVALVGFVGSSATSATAAGDGDSQWAIPAPDWDKDPMVNLGEYENRVMAQINRRRENRGLNPINKYQDCLERKAENWAQHLSEIGKLVHRDQQTVLDDCAVNWAGEDLASGIGMTPENVVDAWMNSESHKDVLLKPRATLAGVGVRTDADGKYYVVLNLGDKG